MKFLGVDYGKKKVGLSISEGEYASPLKVLEVNSLKDALIKIQKVVKDEGIGQIVIGKPESGESLQIVEKFIQEFQKISEIPIELVEETLSSKNALDQMIELGKNKKSRQQEDAYSASQILQSYLDQSR